MIRWLLLLALATSALAGDDLEKRLEPFRDPELRIRGVVVYDRYASGRPRRVVAAIGNASYGDLWLFRFPDSAKGEPRVLDKGDLESGPIGVDLMRIIDAKDIVVTQVVRHGESAIVDHIVNDRFVRIADDFGEAIDLDGDGVPEIVSVAFSRGNQCGVATSAYISHWNGKRFVNDQRRYVASLGPDAADDEILLSAARHYVLHLYGRGRVTLDDEPLEPGKPFQTEEDCHMIALRDAAANTRAFLEELSR